VCEKIGLSFFTDDDFDVEKTVRRCLNHHHTVIIIVEWERKRTRNKEQEQEREEKSFVIICAKRDSCFREFLWNSNYFNR
jgi:hypothetical protein